MQFDSLFNLIPLWSVFVITLLLVLVAVEVGYRTGNYRRMRSEQEKEAPVGAMVGASLGLLAFLLAFTFGLAANRFDDRRHMVIEEVNAIGTSYLRAGMLPETNRHEVRKLLRDYVGVRLEAVRMGKIEEGIRRSEELQGQLWAQAVAVGSQNPESIVIGLFIQSVNEVIDVHSKRILIGVRSRIPGTIWIALYMVAFIALGSMGYHGGLARSSRSFAVLAVAFTFSVVLWLIADLDRSQQGSLRISQEPMENLLKSMRESIP